MRLNVKLLNGTTFPIEFDPEITVADLKLEIESSHPDLTASGQVLIYNGNILKDNIAVSRCGINEDSFVVCMIKKKNTAPAPATSAPAPTPVTNSSTAFTTPIQPRITISSPPAPSNTTAPTPQSQPTLTPVNQRVTRTPAPAPVPSSTSSQNPYVTPARNAPVQQQQQPNTVDVSAIIQELSSMGFPESEARVALQAARGNPDLAIEFLFNGIPESFYQQQQQHLHQPPQQQVGTFPTPTETPTTTAPNARNQSGPLETLRRHPQINTLRAMFQQSPSSIPILLNQIGQTSPEFLEAIHQNRDEFIQILNEPISTTPSTPQPPQSQQAPQAQQQQIPMQEIAAAQAAFVQQIQSMPIEQQRGFAAAFNLTPEQLSKVIASMPPEEFFRFMNSITMGAGSGMGGMGGMGAPGATGGAPPGSHVLRFTQEESEAIRRLMELGFDQSEAVQAYIACDKNETLAANLLYDGMSESYSFPTSSFSQIPPQTVPQTVPQTTTIPTQQPVTTNTPPTQTQENTEEKPKEEEKSKDNNNNNDDDMYS